MIKNFIGTFYKSAYDYSILYSFLKGLLETDNACLWPDWETYGGAGVVEGYCKCVQII